MRRCLFLASAVLITMAGFCVGCADKSAVMPENVTPAPKDPPTEAEKAENLELPPD